MSWTDLKHQPAVTELLRTSLRRGRVAHAYLFAGPRRAGKEMAARTLAQALNCTEKENDACGRCDCCRRIADGSHPDMYWVKPESRSRRITIDPIREFQKSVSLKPTQARVKIGVIVDADCLGEEAGNAFLKTLEEPPAQTVILLLTAEPQRLLPTILSRCLRLSFGATGAAAHSPHRERVIGMLKTFSPRGPEKIVNTYRLQAGLTALLGEMRAEIRQRVEAETNLAQYAELEPKARERLEDEMEARVEGECRSAREQVLEEVYSWFGDLLLQNEGAAARALANPDFAEESRRAATGLSYEQATANIDAVEQIRESLFRNIAEPMAFEIGLLKLQ